MKSRKPKIIGIGLIVEDDSDFKTIRILISKYLETESLKFKKAVGKGCGRMRNKALTYAKNLYTKGCNMVILVHDLDDRSLKKLRSDLQFFLSKSIAEFNFICIPNQEIEAWLLSDEKAISNVFHLQRPIKPIHHPETVKSPKEYLEHLIYNHSNKSKRYINTQHNAKIAERSDVELIAKKCPSFKELLDFLDNYKYS
ncbi:MAG: DUF4276 family protein [Bacteroidota bacterium]